MEECKNVRVVFVKGGFREFEEIEVVLFSNIWMFIEISFVYRSFGLKRKGE